MLTVGDASADSEDTPRASSGQTEPHAAEVAPRQASPAGPTLIVDDDDGLRELLGIILEGEGLRVETAANGREALERLGARPPGLILLDMRMPVMDGWEFCRELDRRGERRPPIVVVTAATDPAQRAEEIHADAWLAKPFERAALLDVVHRFLDAA